MIKSEEFSKFKFTEILHNFEFIIILVTTLFFPFSINKYTI